MLQLSDYFIISVNLKNYTYFSPVVITAISEDIEDRPSLRRHRAKYDPSCMVWEDIYILSHSLVQERTTGLSHPLWLCLVCEVTPGLSHPPWLWMVCEGTPGLSHTTWLWMVCKETLELSHPPWMSLVREGTLRLSHSPWLSLVCEGHWAVTPTMAVPVL